MVKVVIKGVKAVRKTGGRKGDRVLYYWRRPGYKLRRLPDDPNTPAFISLVIQWNAEADASAGFGGPLPGSFSELVSAYRASPDFEELAPKTRHGYGYWLDILDKRFGRFPVSGIDREVVYRLRDSMAATPFKANAIVSTLRMLLNFGIDRGTVTSNPALRPKRLRTKPRRAVWSLEAEAAFLAAASPTMALGYKIAAYTAQRPSDVLAMAWSQYDGEVIRLRQQKTDELVEVTCHVDLRAALDAAPRRGVLMLLTARGHAFKTLYFARLWRQTRERAGVDGLQFRDLRRTAMVRMAEAGATAIEIAGVSGHLIDSTQRILEAYIPRSAAMAKAAIIKLEQSKKVKE